MSTRAGGGTIVSLGAVPLVCGGDRSLGPVSVSEVSLCGAGDAAETKARGRIGDGAIEGYFNRGCVGAGEVGGNDSIGRRVVAAGGIRGRTGGW